MERRDRSQQFAFKVQDSAPTTAGGAAPRDTRVSYKPIRVGIKRALLPTWHEKRGDACLPPIQVLSDCRNTLGPRRLVCPRFGYWSLTIMKWCAAACVPC